MFKVNNNYKKSESENVKQIIQIYKAYIDPDVEKDRSSRPEVFCKMMFLEIS